MNTQIALVVLLEGNSITLKIDRTRKDELDGFFKSVVEHSVKTQRHAESVDGHWFVNEKLIGWYFNEIPEKAIDEKAVAIKSGVGEGPQPVKGREWKAS